MSVLTASLTSLFLAQMLKVFSGERIDVSRLVGSGGMPSSHSSFVSTLVTIIGLKHGIRSDLFAVVVVFSLIIIYDATGVRRAVGEQANVLNHMIAHLDLRNIDKEREFIKKELKELVGHTPLEVIVGCLLGSLLGFVYWYL